MKKSYSVVGKVKVQSKKVAMLSEYIASNYTKTNKRLGVPNFVKEFGKFNDEKMTLQAASVPTVKEIRNACEFVALSVKDRAEFIPVLVSNNGTITIETRKASEFDNYYTPISEGEGEGEGKVEKSNLEKILAYIESKKEGVDKQALIDAIQDMTF